MKLFDMKSLVPDSDGILKAWRYCKGKPFGNRIFSKAVGLAIPYTGSIRPLVLELDIGKSQVQLDDHRSIRNHLSSVHAIALANVGEFSTGLAVTTASGPGARAILKSIKVEYLKKARGTLIAKASTPKMEVTGKSDVEVTAEIFNAGGDVVARVEALWQVGPK